MAGVDYARIISDPIFRLGYDEIWLEAESAIDVAWGDAERLSYARGRQFGAVIKGLDVGKLPLLRGGVVYARTETFLIRAMRTGDVR